MNTSERGKSSQLVTETIRAIHHLGVQIPVEASVQKYLEQSIDLIPYLNVVSDKFSRRFAQRAQLSLEVYEDPEIDDHYLTLYVRQSTYEPTLSQEIDSLFTECNEFAGKSLGYLLVTTDFKSVGQ